MRYNEFEKHISETLGSQTGDVDINALMSAIRAPEKPARRVFAWWFLLPILLGASTVWYFYQTVTNTTVETKNVNSSIEKTEKSTLTSLENPKENVIEKTQKSLSPVSADSNLQESAEENSGKNLIPASFSSDSKAINDNSSTISNSKNSSLTINDDYAETNQSSDNDLISAVSHTKDDQKLKNRSLENVTSLISNLKLLADLDQDEEGLGSKMKINCPDFDKARWHFSIVPEIGAFMPKKHLGYQNGEVPTSFDLRSSEEQSLPGLSAALYGMILRDDMPFYVKAGFSYNRFIEKMNYDYEYTEQDTTVGIISTTVSANGDTITHIYGDIITETTYRGTESRHYRLSTVNLPVALGYNMYFRGFDIGFEGGVNFNLTTYSSGHIIGQEEIAYIPVKESQFFKKRLGLSYFGGISINKNISPWCDIFISPRISVYPEGFNSSNNQISQMYTVFGLYSGIIYKIQ